MSGEELGQALADKRDEYVEEIKRSKQLQNRQMPPQLLVKQVSHAQNQIQQGDFEGVIDTCQPLLSLLPRRSPLRVHALALLGLAHGMLEEYQDSYDLFTEAL